MRTQQPLRVDCTERNMWLQVRRRVGHASTGTQLAAQRRVGPNHSYPIGQDRNYYAGHPPQYSFAPVDAHTCLFALSGRSCAAVPATDAHQQQLFSSECALCCAVLLRTAWSLSAAPSLAKSTGPKISPNSRTRTAVCTALRIGTARGFTQEPCSLSCACSCRNEQGVRSAERAGEGTCAAGGRAGSVSLLVTCLVLVRQADSGESVVSRE